MKTKSLIIRLSQAEKDLIKSLAAKLGFKTSEYIRKASLHPSVDLTKIEKGINEIEKKGLK